MASSTRLRGKGFSQLQRLLRASATGLIAACILASCSSDGVYTAVDGGGRRNFSELGVRRSRPQPPASAPSRLATATMAQAPSSSVSASEPSVHGPTPVSAARRSIDAFLRSRGFLPEADAAGDRITATRMTTERLAADEADCSLHSLARPQMYATTVIVRLSPQTVSPEAVRVDARFTVMDVGVVSGALTKHVCRSRGLLEAEVRRAARLGGMG